MSQNYVYDMNAISVMVVTRTVIIYCWPKAVEQCSIYTVSAKTENTFYYCSHIRTLLCSLFAVVIATVVLAVIYLGHIKNCSVM